MGIYEKIKDLGGWLAEGEAELLYDLAAKAPKNGKIVEIGSWKGRSTIGLASGSKKANGGKITAIDPHTGSSEHQGGGQGVNTFEEFKKNINEAGLADMIQPIVKKSSEAVNDFHEPISLIFIDGGHEYEFVKQDFDQWVPKVVDGGIVALHDTISWGGPRQVAEKDLFLSRNFKDTGFVNSISYGTKTEKNNLFDRCRNRYILFLKNTFDLLWSLRKKSGLLKKMERMFGKRINKIFRSMQ